MFNYIRHCLASLEGIVSLGVRHAVCVCVRRISLDGKGNALYPVLSGLIYFRNSLIWVNSYYVVWIMYVRACVFNYYRCTKLQFIHALTAKCSDEHTENSKNHKR